MKTKTQQKIENRMRRHARIRARVKGTAERPRLVVFRSARHITAQIINDEKGITLAAAGDLTAKGKKTARAKDVGLAIAKAAAAKKITQVVFDRGGFLYAGRIKELADAAREGGLTF